MENKEIEKNVKLFIKFLNNPNLSMLNTEEKEAILEVNNLCKTDPEFNEMVNKLKGGFSDETRMNMLNDYLNQKELKEAKSNEEVISKTFGVDINDIEHKYLNSGKEIFSFYDSKIGRKRLLENPSDGTLVEFLKEEQNNNEDFQSDDYKANSTAILNEKLKEKNIELKMIYIGDLNDHQKEIDNLEEKKKKCLEEILKNKEKLGVVYVNLEDIVALDKDGKIIEGAYNDEKQKAEVQSPKEANYRAQEISNENNDVSSNENNGESYFTDNTSVNEFNEFEDIPDIINAEGIDPAMREEVAANLKKYYKNPDAMLSLAPLEREYYEKLVGILSEKIELKKENKQVMTLKNPDNKWGFSNIVLLSIIAIALAIVVLIMIL
ncbi:MAG TPA: hypothetical protein DHV70_06815 [Firmicutes bacterium]|nr:hypothetical protein [Bacillota bacterium]